MTKKFGDFTYFEVAKECEKHDICPLCPFVEVCYFSATNLCPPSIEKDCETYEKIITIEE